MSGQVEPDTYVVGRAGPACSTYGSGIKTTKIVQGADGHDQQICLDASEGSRRVLSDDEVLGLASLGLAVEAHYGTPQDVEWAIAGGHTYLVQSRPITTTGGGFLGTGDDGPQTGGSGVQGVRRGT